MLGKTKYAAEVAAGDTVVPTGAPALAGRGCCDPDAATSRHANASAGRAGAADPTGHGHVRPGPGGSGRGRGDAQRRTGFCSSTGWHVATQTRSRSTSESCSTARRTPTARTSLRRLPTPRNPRADRAPDHPAHAFPAVKSSKARERRSLAGHAHGLTATRRLWTLTIATRWIPWLSGASRAYAAPHGRPCRVVRGRHVPAYHRGMARN